MKNLQLIGIVTIKLKHFQFSLKILQFCRKRLFCYDLSGNGSIFTSVSIEYFNKKNDFPSVPRLGQKLNYEIHTKIKINLIDYFKLLG